jgi:hypothetical protein
MGRLIATLELYSALNPEPSPGMSPSAGIVSSMMGAQAHSPSSTPAAPFNTTSMTTPAPSPRTPAPGRSVGFLRRRPRAWERFDWSAEATAQLLALRAAGQSLNQIAIALGTTAAKCKEKLKRLRRAAIAPAVPASAAVSPVAAVAPPSTAPVSSSLPTPAATGSATTPPANVSHRRRQSRRRRDTWTQSMTDQLLALRAAGQSYAQIANVLGTTASKCRSRVYRLRRNSSPAQHSGVRIRGQRWSAEESATLERLYQQGLGWQQIALEIPGRSAEQCRWRARSLEDMGRLVWRDRGPQDVVDSS